MKGRTYRYMPDALFPFGFGLSYTTFSIGDATLNRTEIKKDESIELTIAVSNTGKYDGTEIIQVYVHKVGDSDGPIKTLKGYQRVKLSASKTGQAVINLPYSSFEFFDREKVKMLVSPGEYEIFYGNSSDSKNLKIIKILVQ